MIKIPISFEYKGKNYSGEFNAIHGAGTQVYHLYVDQFFYGRLRTHNGCWVFDPSRFGMEDLAQFFGYYVTNHSNK